MRETFPTKKVVADNKASFKAKTTRGESDEYNKMP
jgi:hypothetical protein